MTSYVAIPDTPLGIGKPVTSTIARSLRDNPIALAEGNSAAPRIWHQALRYTDFTASGSFVVPDGCTKVYVELVGGGAGGRYFGSAQVNYGAGAGGFAAGWFTVTPGDIIPVTIGAGGTGEVSGGAPATNGGTSSFGSLVSATGGTVGAQQAAYNAAYNSLTIIQDLFTTLEATQNGGSGVGGDFIMQGSRGAFEFSDPAQGGRGIGGAGGSNLAGVYYGDGGGARQGVSPAYAGKSGFCRVWH